MGRNLVLDVSKSQAVGPDSDRGISRRKLLGGVALAAPAVAGLAAFSRDGSAVAEPGPGAAHNAHPGHAEFPHAAFASGRRVDHAANGFHPTELLRDFDYGRTRRLPGGRVLREWEIVAHDREIEVAPGVSYEAWTYNGRVPGPTIRVTEGERVRVRFENAGSHPHSMHFHGIHAARMDGVPGAGEVLPGGAFVYEFDAFPFGCHLYHCHTVPLKRHIHKGLYGAFIIDPDPARHPDALDAARGRLLGTPENGRWQELVMVMNAFDTNFDEENEVYAVNTVAHAYSKRPIVIDKTRPVRVYLVNITEFDPINSFHLHGNFFDYYDHGTTLAPTARTIDTVMQCQAQRGILEFSFAQHEPGFYMAHAHQTEFVELGWMSLFDVRGGATA
jgi:manganese oxidase